MNCKVKKIVILRHGEAEPPIRAGVNGDAQRKLTFSGEKMCYNAAESIMPALEKASVGFSENDLKKTASDIATNKLDIIFYSPFLRTEATAKIIYDYFRDSNSYCTPLLQASDRLLGDNTAIDVVDWLAELPYQNILLVSHQPLVADLTQCLLTGQSVRRSEYRFEPASFALLSGEFVAKGCMTLDSQVHQYKNGKF